MKIARIAATVALLGCSISHAFAAVDVDAYATKVISFSSQWSGGGWSAGQALGAPNTSGYGDISTAWAPSSMNGTLEYLTLGYAVPVYSTGATIRETYGNGFVYRVDAIDTSGGAHQVWSGADSSLPGTPVDFTVSWATTTFQTAGLKIYTNTSHNPGAWEEIDSVKLSGQMAAPIPEPETYAMMMAGLGLLGFVARRRKHVID